MEFEADLSTLEFILILLAIVGFAILIFRKRNKKIVREPVVVQVSPLELLSKRELEVLQQIAEGKSNKEIAETLFIDVSTVKSHVNNIYKTLKISNRKEAVALIKFQSGQME